MVENEQQKQVINQLKEKLNELLMSNLDKKTKIKVKGYLQDLKNVFENKDNLVELVLKLEALNIIDIPEDLKMLVSETSEIISEDYAFWSEFIFETIGFVLQIEKKVNEKEPHCFSLFKGICKKLK